MITYEVSKLPDYLQTCITSQGERMITYEVSKLPDRKQYCLLRTEDNRSTIVAWFVSKEAAELFKKELAR